MQTPQKIINSVILTIIMLGITGALYPSLSNYVTNITTTTYCLAGAIATTCNGTIGYGTIYSNSNSALLVVISLLYWILVSAGIVLYWAKTIKTE